MTLLLLNVLLNDIVITEWNRRPQCPINLRYKLTGRGILLQWTQNDISVSNFFVGCGIVAEGRLIYKLGSDTTEFEFVHLCK